VTRPQVLSSVAQATLPTARPIQTAVDNQTPVFGRKFSHLAVGTARADGLFCISASDALVRTGRTPNV
jgi:hypothetical protein